MILRILYLLFCLIQSGIFISQGIEKYLGDLIEGYGPGIKVILCLFINTIFLFIFYFKRKENKFSEIVIYSCVFEFVLFIGIIFSLKYFWIIGHTLTTLLLLISFIKTTKATAR